MPHTVDYQTEIPPQLQAVRQAARKLAQLSDENIQEVILRLADLTEANIPVLLDANALDLARMDPANPKYDRLLLNEGRLRAIAADLRKVAKLPSPLGQQLESYQLPNGLDIERVTVPLGVVGIVFESRPNVTFDVFALCLRSGNASVLKGSRDAHDSNQAILKLIQQALVPFGLEEVCFLAPSEREALPVILNAEGLVDVIIPRGSQGLIDFVRANACVPVIETGAGIVHSYFTKTADLEKGKAIITNAKARRVSVCNALDCLLIDASRLDDLPYLLNDLGQVHQCKVFADEQSYAVLSKHYPAEQLEPANQDSFGTEFLSMQMSIKTVQSITEALDHIDLYSSRHSEAIITEDEEEAKQFLKAVDAAVVYHNTSTAYTDGAQFGLGAEIGISTQKLHARGPMALRELTSYKWVVRGNGQVRS